MVKEQKGRILLAKIGLDGHDRGIKYLGHILREYGFEVIYTGIRRTASEIALSATQEDVDVIGISILSGAHMELIPEVMHHLELNGASDIPIVVGGIIPENDQTALLEMGVKAIKGPGASKIEICGTFSSEASKS